jgi:hypothetical protein
MVPPLEWAALPLADPEARDVGASVDGVLGRHHAQVEVTSYLDGEYPRVWPPVEVLMGALGKLLSPVQLLVECMWIAWWQHCSSMYVLGPWSQPGSMHCHKIRAEEVAFATHQLELYGPSSPLEEAQLPPKPYASTSASSGMLLQQHYVRM